MDTEEKVIILAKINQLKDMQIYLLKEEKKLRREYKRLQQLEEEREEVIK
jgi:inorganic pyrophosphatase